MIKRALATLAISTMMAAVPTAAFATNSSSGDTTNTCNSKGANKGGTCNTTVIGDTDGDGQVRYECRNAAGGFIVVNAANCTDINFPILVIVDL